MKDIEVLARENGWVVLSVRLDWFCQRMVLLAAAFVPPMKTGLEATTSHSGRFQDARDKDGGRQRVRLMDKMTYL